MSTGFSLTCLRQLGTITVEELPIFWACRSRPVLPKLPDLVRSSDAVLQRYGVEVLNLACAQALPDAKDVNADRCLDRVASLARQVDRFTERLWPQLQRSPEDFNGSEAYFRALCLITHLQRDCGIRYNPAKIPDDVPLDTADVFLHGALLGDGGTCASLPVLYVAVGRRLGYPLKLVVARRGHFGHLFARWEGPTGERFNVEATNKGLSCHPDDYYRTGMYALEPEVERRIGLLKSMSPREELASFLAERAHRWEEFGNHRRAVEAFLWSMSLAPQNESYAGTAKRLMDEWVRKLEARKPPGFPDIYIQAPQRRFGDAVPLAAERNVLGLEAMENLLDDPHHERNWWEPSRKGQRARMPTVALFEFAPDGGCVAEYRYPQHANPSP
jgi:hypothetical protein